MRVWVTGICGFLGSHVAEQLCLQGHDVDGNDNLICGDVANIPHKQGFWRSDCCSFGVLSAQMKSFRPEVVVHCAATAHEGFSNFSPSFITRNIFEASVSVFSASIAAGAKRIVYMSSMARYGNQMTPFTEDLPTRPVDPYGIAKVAAEDVLKNLCKTHDVKWSIAVPHNIIGIRQRYVDPYRNVAAIMINRCKQGKAPIIYGNGQQKRCFSPVQDCLPSIMGMIEGAADGHVVNIGPDDNPVTIWELMNEICNLTGYNGEPHYLLPRPNEVRDAFTCSDKARTMLNYKERQTLGDCLKEMVATIKPKPFIYDFPLEIDSDEMPSTWRERTM